MSTTVREQRARSISTDNRIVTECRRMRAYDVMQMCIKHDWYTHGDSRAYEKMLDFVSDNPVEAVTLEGMYYIARDIAKHSDLTEYGCNLCEPEAEAISTIMYALNDEATNIFYALDDVEEATNTEEYFR